MLNEKGGYRFCQAVLDEAFRGPEAQFFEGAHLFNGNQCRMVSA